MDRARIHHLSMGIIGLSLGLNGALTGVSDVAGAAMVSGGTCPAVLSGYSLLTDADSSIGRRGAYLSAFGAVLSVVGTALTLLG
jgi:hypothetical protein